MISKYGTETTDIQHNVSDVKNVQVLKKFYVFFLKKPTTLFTTRQNENILGTFC